MKALLGGTSVAAKLLADFNACVDSADRDPATGAA